MVGCMAKVFMTFLQCLTRSFQLCNVVCELLYVLFRLLRSFMLGFLGSLDRLSEIVNEATERKVDDSKECHHYCDHDRVFPRLSYSTGDYCSGQVNGRGIEQVFIPNLDERNFFLKRGKHSDTHGIH